MYDENTTLGWGTLALINAAIAQMKNRNAAGWLVGSLVMGPLATALLVLFPKLEMTPETLERVKKNEKLTTIVLTVVVIIMAVALAAVLIMFVTRGR